MSGEKYVHGQMDVAENEKTFDGFIRMVTRATILCIVVLIFLGLVNG